MVVLVTFLQTSQDGDGTEFIRLIHHHCLESTFERFILLKVFLVFVQGCCTNGTQFSTGERRFQDVGSIHRTLTTTGTYQRVDLIDEEDDAAFRLRHLVDDALQAFLKLTLILRTSHERTHVEGIELLVLQVLRYITPYDTTSQSFHDGGLTGTRFTDQNGVVLGTTRKDLKQPTDLIITTDHGVKFALTGEIDEVLRVLLQRLIVVVSRL